MVSACDLETGVSQRPLGSCDSSQSRAQPSGNAPTNQQPSKHDGLYSQILEDRRADRQEPTPEDEFYGRYDIGKITVNGFPSIAAFHAKYPNTRTCRAFEYLNHRITTRHQCQLTCLLGALVDLDIESARKSEIPGEKGSQPVPFDKDRFISRCLRSPDQISLVHIPLGDEGCEEDEEQKKERIEAMRENIFANIERIMDKYCNRINWQYKLGKFPRASAKTHGKLFKYIKNMSGLDPEALDYLRAEDDFIYADGNPLYEQLYNFLIYIRAAFVKAVRFLSCKRLFLDGDVPFGSGVYSAQRIRLMLQSLMLASSAILLLTPVGVLYLLMPPKEIAFLVVAVFGLIFGFILIALGFQMGHVLLGLAAYYAVLVDFLSRNN